MWLLRSGNIVKIAGISSLMSISKYTSLFTMTDFVSRVPRGLFALLRCAGTVTTKGQIPILPSKMHSFVSGSNRGLAIADKNMIFQETFWTCMTYKGVLLPGQECTSGLFLWSQTTSHPHEFRQKHPWTVDLCELFQALFWTGDIWACRFRSQEWEMALCCLSGDLTLHVRCDSAMLTLECHNFMQVLLLFSAFSQEAAK